jgi:DNA-binding response OmpR family regulator
VAVVDLMLPGVDGWRITETLRSEGIETPIVIVSARGSEHDKVHALQIGGDDYLAKPFGMRELVARVEAVLRRAGMSPVGAKAQAIEAPGLAIDPDLHAALLDGADAGLTPTEFRLLYVLASEQGRALTRDQLQQRVWGMPHRHRDRTVDVCVRKLREKLDRRSASHTYIQTHYGVGYRFDPVEKT